MNITLISSYAICAAHQLSRADWTAEKNTQVFGKCATLHGHEYKVEIYLSGHVDGETGMLINGYDVDAIVKPHVMDVLDHKCLNDDVAFFRDHLPTAEWIAYFIYDVLKNQFPKHVTLSKVRVYETATLAAEYPAA